MRAFSALTALAIVSADSNTAYCLPQGSTLGSAGTDAPTLTVSTSVASPTVPLAKYLPSQVPLPPVQAWCPSQIFCPGKLLQTINVASVYSDPKTFVDKPTKFSSETVLSAFQDIVSSAGDSLTNITEEQIVNFVDNNFIGEGLELKAFALPNFNPNPPLLNNVPDPLLRAWVQIVHKYWTQLLRETNSSAICGESMNSGSCEGTLIPLNHSFVVPGGRFREQYYWDSYWIIQGLIESQMLDIANATLQNFMYELERFGFIPNGCRTYYLNRSQPPLFIHMLSNYVSASNDTTILTRALPLAELELAFWNNNRTLNVTSPYTNRTYSISRYFVTNTAPRPESYLTDYEIANGADIKTPFTDVEKADLFAELASGAESGWDYTVRFFKQPHAGATNDTAVAQRTINIRSTIPICLNSILYKAHELLAVLYSTPFLSSLDINNRELAAAHQAAANDRREAILDLFWDPEKLAFYDFNLTSNSRNSIFSAAHFYPMWNGIFPDELLVNETAAFGAFSSVNMVLSKFNGTFPSTFTESGQQWDAPNAWPPHQYIVLSAIANVPLNVSTKGVPSSPPGKSSFALIPTGQLGLEEKDLPGQPIAPRKNASIDLDTSRLEGTVVNGGNPAVHETWVQALQRELANRYITSVLCSWHATGGSIPGILPRLSDAELNVTQSVTNTGNMFEKFSLTDVNSAGRGGEYTVQAGFGWTNGVALWIASNYGNVLTAPNCPDLLADAAITGSST